MNQYKVGRFIERAPGCEAERIINCHNPAEDEYFDEILGGDKNAGKRNGNANNSLNSQPPNFRQQHTPPSLSNSKTSSNNNANLTSDSNNSLPSSTSSYGVPLAVCQVIYLGACAPEPGTSGLQAVQKPLLQLYRDTTLPNEVSPTSTNNTTHSSFISGIIKGGTEATLAVYSFGLKLIYLPNSDSPSVNIWFPISNLFVCAAVRCIRSLPLSRRFVPLDLAEADESDEAPLFAAIFRQSRARHVTECFCFVCKSKQNAMDLVLGCTNAFESFVRSRPQPSDNDAKGHNSETGDSCEMAGAQNQPDRGEPQDETQSSECDGGPNEEWQPILVRRVWLPAAAQPVPKVYYSSTTAKSSSNLQKKMQSRKNKSNTRNAEDLLLEHHQQDLQSPLSNSYYDQQPMMRKMQVPTAASLGSHSAASLMRWPSSDAALVPSSGCCVPAASGSRRSHIRLPAQQQHRRHQQQQQPMMTTSSLSLHAGDNISYNVAKPTLDEQMFHTCHRQWSSQPSLDMMTGTVDGVACGLCYSPHQQRNFRTNNVRKNSFVNKMRNFIFPTTKRGYASSSKMPLAATSNDIQQRRRFKAKGCGNNNGQQTGGNNIIDYATVASDEADLLRVQNDCYGGSVISGNNNTLTRHPLPNERAFMISIRNQQQCQVGSTAKNNGSKQQATAHEKNKAACTTVNNNNSSDYNNNERTACTEIHASNISQNEAMHNNNKAKQLKNKPNNCSSRKSLECDNQRNVPKQFNLSAFSNINGMSPPSYWND